MNHLRLSIVGSGAFGTALAIAASRNGVSTLLWGPEAKALQLIEQEW